MDQSYESPKGRTDVDIIRERSKVDVEVFQANINQQNQKLRLDEQVINEQLQREMSQMGQQKKSITGGIPLDQLPLNWAKQKEIVKILQILNQCFGPYSTNNNKNGVDTTANFKEIYKIALDCYNDYLKRSKAVVKIPEKKIV